jgi:glycosyltransferase involved in cell wall biosynthesis
MSPSGSRPIASVIIPTWNRSALLRDAVESLWRQTLDAAAFEIIVVDNRSTDDTPAVMAEMIARSPCRMVYHVMDQDRGPTRSRNTGARLALGSILAFTDSDCRADAGWLERGLAACTPGVAFVSGRTMDKPEQPVRFFTRTMSGFVDENPTFPTCNVLYRREVFDRMGGFREDLCFRGPFNRATEAADSDLAWRIKEAGLASAYEPAAVVYHEVEGQSPSDWMAEAFRLYSVAALVKLHPGVRRRLLHWRVFVSRANLLFYLAAAGLSLALVRHWWFAALALPYVVYWSTQLLQRTGSRLAPSKVAAQVVLLAVRHSIGCAGLLYGSVRFRALVL